MFCSFMRQWTFVLFPLFTYYELCWYEHFDTRFCTGIHFFVSLESILRSGISGFCGNSRRRQWHPTPELLPGKSHGWRSLVGCSPWGREESDTTGWLHFHFSLSCIGEGNGNPLHCSCLEDPRDGGAWWAAVYGVAQSRTRLKRLSSSTSSTVTLCLTFWWTSRLFSKVAAPFYNPNSLRVSIRVHSCKDKLSWPDRWPSPCFLRGKGGYAWSLCVICRLKSLYGSDYHLRSPKSSQ